jgi:hypothetical protein
MVDQEEKRKVLTVCTTLAVILVPPLLTPFAFSAQIWHP